MTPPARLAAAIELVDLIAAAARDDGAAADTIIARWFSTRRYAGSKDRRAVRELVYRVIRRFGEPVVAREAFAALADEDPALAQAFDGSGYGPPPLQPDERRETVGAVSSWLSASIPQIEHAALLQRAPLDLRVNRLRTTRDDVIALLGGEPVAYVDDAIRFAEPFAAEATDAWAQGLFEVQDAGSQLVARAAHAEPGMTVVDLCAGGGGKTLALGNAMIGEGRLIACDTDRMRLSKLTPRVQRAGAKVEIRLLDPKRESEMLADLNGQADVVLVDAPCSGTGTLRRNPEVRWRLQPARLDRLVALQGHVLNLAAPLVRSGGTLVYAVCSLLDREGSGAIDRFLAAHDGWVPEQPFEPGRVRGVGRILTPSYDSTDGFFVARLRKSC